MIKSLIILLLLSHTPFLYASEIPSLIDNLKNRNKAEEASEKLTKIGKPAVPALSRTLYNGTQYQKRYAAKALRDMGQNAEGATSTLQAIARFSWIDSKRNDDSQTRIYAIEALTNIKHCEIMLENSVLPSLRGVLSDNEAGKDVKKAAEKAIAKLEENRRREIQLAKQKAEQQRVYESQQRKLREEKQKKLREAEQERLLSVEQNSFDLAETRSKSEIFNNKTLVFKGFYLGMPVEDALGLINYYMGFKQTSATPIEYDDDSLIDDISDPNEPYKAYLHKDRIFIAQTPSQKPFAFADSSKAISKFQLSKEVTDKLFGSSKMPVEEFLKTFMKAYNIPKLEYDRVEIQFFFSDIGFQNIYRHRSPLGYEMIYYANSIFYVESIWFRSGIEPEGTIIINKIKTQEEMEAKFD